jgi:hypothetical protein
MPASVTINGRITPADLRFSATSDLAPTPKWIVVGKAKR